MRNQTSPIFQHSCGIPFAAASKGQFLSVSVIRPAWAAVVVALLLAGSHSPLIAATLMYVANSGNGTISAVADNGSVSTFATGLQQPAGLALDRWGNLYAGDLGVGGGLVGTIKKITPDGHVSTWASGFNWPTSLTFDGAGNLYVACNGYATTGSAIVRITPGGSITIFATAVDGPAGLAFDRSGNLFVANYSAQTISKITPDGTVSTFASLSSGRLTGLAFDAVGNLYVVCLDGYVIQKITPAGTISTFATGETWPASLGFDQSGYLYLADYIANRVERVGPAGGSVSTFATGFSEPNGIAMVPHGPSIVTPPQSQTAQAGSSVTFSVAATGTPPMSFQWRKDGANIAGATSPTLTLSSVGAGNAGGYSVVVWNAINSAVSAPASLAVLADCANGNAPAQISGPPGPTKPSGKNNLVVVTHGCQPGLGVQAPPQWVSDMCSGIQSRVSSDWQVFPYFWTAEAWAPTELAGVSYLWELESKVMPNAQSLGVQLGRQIAAQGWQHVHFMGHSAGAALIQKAADTLRGLAGSATEIHTTFLDPYLDLNYYGRSWYGQNADWADCYYALDTETHNYTDGPLSYAYSVDVTWMDPSKTLATIYCYTPSAPGSTPMASLPCGQQATSSHEWPHYFYANSIVGTVPACAAGYGFPMSKEGGGWANRGNYPPNGNPPVPCGSSPMVQNPLPLATGQPLQLASLPYAASPSGVTLLTAGGATLSTSPRVYGIDVSVFQGQITLDQWTQLKSQGRSYVWIRATKGSADSAGDCEFIDPNFSANVSGAKAAGLAVGAYHIGNVVQYAATNEADFFVSVAGDSITPGNLRPVLDLEAHSCGDPASLGVSGLATWVNQWMAEVTRLTGVTPIIYCNRSYLQNLDPSLAQKYDLWVASFTDNPESTVSATPWSAWTVFQYSTNGSIGGIQPLDLDVFYGTAQDFQTKVMVPGSMMPQDDSFPVGGPSWLAVVLTVTNPVNFVQFDAGFTDTNAAQGLLTVYWNTNQVGMVDERAASPGLQTYRFTLPATVTNGLYTLGFRLDTFTNIASSITVTNVATGFAGIAQPISLAMLLMGSNNTPVLKLTAAPGYNYLVQSSTNLVDWLPTALFANTNGAVLFADPAVTNSGPKFYRALMQ